MQPCQNLLNHPHSNTQQAELSWTALPSKGWSSCQGVHAEENAQEAAVRQTPVWISGALSFSLRSRCWRTVHPCHTRGRSCAWGARILSEHCVTPVWARELLEDLRAEMLAITARKARQHLKAPCSRLISVWGRLAVGFCRLTSQHSDCLGFPFDLLFVCCLC